MSEEPKIKLTKSALSKFIKWSTSRYNSYCGYGNKKENIELVYRSLVNGCFTNHRGIAEREKTSFNIECASGVGENGNGRYWKTKQSGGSYLINCIEKSVESIYTKNKIYFL